MPSPSQFVLVMQVKGALKVAPFRGEGDDDSYLHEQVVEEL
jgi:hypothetical protein